MVGAYVSESRRKGNATPFGDAQQTLATVIGQGQVMMQPNSGKSILCGMGALAVFSLFLAACQSVDAIGLSEAEQAAAGPKQCSFPLPSGAPAKPDRLSAFGTATALNVGKSVGRNAIAGAGSFVGGPVGGAVAGNIAARALPSSFDIRGNWKMTDGNSGCGCALSFSAKGTWSGANLPRGTVRATGCNNALIASAHDWRLDETMTGLDAELLLYAGNGNRIALLRRDGPDYYSGQLSTGQQVTLWRN